MKRWVVNPVHAEVCRKQCELLAKDFPGYDVRIGFNEFIGPLFTDVAKEMVNDGIKKIAFIPMLQTDSTHTGEVWNKIEAIELDKKGVKWVMSKPLFYRPEPTTICDRENCSNGRENTAQ